MSILSLYRRHNSSDSGGYSGLFDTVCQGVHSLRGSDGGLSWLRHDGHTMVHVHWVHAAIAQESLEIGARGKVVREPPVAVGWMGLGQGLRLQYSMLSCTTAITASTTTTATTTTFKLLPLLSKCFTGS